MYFIYGDYCRYLWQLGCEKARIGKIWKIAKRNYCKSVELEVCVGWTLINTWQIVNFEEPFCDWLTDWCVSVHLSDCFVVCGWILETRLANWLSCLLACRQGSVNTNYFSIENLSSLKYISGFIEIWKLSFFLLFLL